MASSSKTFTTPEGRASFPYLFKPSMREGQEPKYQLTLLLPKNSPDVQKFMGEAQAEIQRLIAEKWQNAEKRPGIKAMKMAIKDGDKAEFNQGEMTGALKKEKYQEMAGCWVLGANGTRRPTVIDRSGNIITDESVIYAGCWVRAMVNFFVYSNVNVGVGCGLRHVLFVRDDESFGGGGGNPKEGFKDFLGQPAGEAPRAATKAEENMFG